VSRERIQTLFCETLTELCELEMTWKVIISLCFVLQLFDVCDTRAFPPTCGQVVADNNAIEMRINNGEFAERGQFPWLGVWCHGNTTEKCFCSVNLITVDAVVAAAHCLRDKGQDEGTEWPETSIHFGRLDLTNEEEQQHSQVRNVIDVFIHNDWKLGSEAYDADIAVLRLNKPVRFTTITQPICLPTTTDFNGGDSKGFVVSRSCYHF